MLELLQTFVLHQLEDLDGFSKQFKLLVTDRHLPESLNADVRVIVDELLSNLLKYGGGSCLQVRCYRSDDKLELHCIDDGELFNPLETARPDLDVPIEERQIGGLGLELIRALTESQSYHQDEERNYLTLTLSLLPAGDTHGP